MALPKAFISAWYAWLHADAPIWNSRERHWRAPGYEIEVPLDHLISHLYSLGLYAIEGRPINYTQLAAEELSELDQISTQLQNIKLDEGEEAAFAQYISLTRALIEELGRLPYTPAAADD
jgi:hypothetical protein